MRHTRILVIVAVVVIVGGAGLYGTVGLSSTVSDRSITIDVVNQSEGVVGIDADYSVTTTGNETQLATITNQGSRTYYLTESVNGDTRTYSLDPAEQTDVVVDVDCNATSSETYEIKLNAETDEPQGNIRVESTTSVAVTCLN